jgi:DNA-binding transcriptional regulator/RsmH inhibitor MraZ
LEQRGRAHRLADVEANHQEVEADAKGRWRLSRALTDVVCIKKRVVFCSRGWWLELWDQQQRQERLANPCSPQPCPGSPALPIPEPTVPRKISGAR